jgi:hypothetical protein
MGGAMIALFLAHVLGGFLGGSSAVLHGSQKRGGVRVVSG